jgi:hypothetical protein
MNYGSIGILARPIVGVGILANLSHLSPRHLHGSIRIPSWPIIFTAALKRRCSVPLRKQRLNTCSLDIVSRSRHNVLPKECRPGPCPLNTIPRFQYGALLRGLYAFNGFLSGFISIDIVSRSRHNVLPKECRPGPCPLNTIPRFQYGALLRGLYAFNGFLSGFIH